MTSVTHRNASKEVYLTDRPSVRETVVASAVLFDFGGTLEADGLRWCERIHAAYQAAGGALSLEEFEPLFKESDRRLEAMPGVRGLGFQEMVFAQARLLRELVPRGAPLKVTRTAVGFCEDAVRTARRNRSVLARLAARLPLGVISNFTGNLDRCLAELELKDLFRVTVDSAVVGVSKPSPEIFRIALGRLGLSGKEVWMVGDNYEADIRPAATLGLSTCWLAPPGRPEPSPGLATARIARLTDLPSVVG
jgi:FMN phosphatase YigB (HAD superfamily)